MTKLNAVLDASFWINGHWGGIAVLLQKFVRDGLGRHRIDLAVRAYANGELNLSGAARYAGIGVEEMMRKLERRGIDYGPTVEQFLDGLETLADDFGVDELRQVAAEMRRQEGLPIR